MSMFNLDLKIHQIKKLVNSRLSSLNVNTSVLNHNASSKSTSSTVDVNAQAPVQESDARRIQDAQPPTLVDMSNSMENSQPHGSSHSQVIGLHQTATPYARSFRRRFFAYHNAVNHPHTNIILPWFSIPLVLKCAAKILKIGLQIKI